MKSDSPTFPSVPLAALCRADRGITYGIVKVGDFVQDGVRVIRGGDIRNNRITVDESKRVSDEVSQQFKRTILRGGEIVLNLIAEPGHSAIVPASLSGANVTRDVAVIPVSDGDARFVNYYFQSPQCIDWLRAHLQGSVTLKINLGTLTALPVPVPPADEQQRVVAVLGALDDKIESNRRAMELIEDLGGSILDTVLDLDVYGFPKYEPNQRLGDILSVLETGSRPKGGASTDGVGIVSLGAESIQSAGIITTQKFKTVPQEYAEGMRRGRLENEDILVYKDGGRPGNFVPHISAFGYGFPVDEAVINEHVYRARAIDGVSQGLLYWLLRSPWMDQEMRKHGTGVAIPGLNSTNFRSLPTPVLPPETIDQLNDKLSPMLAALLRYGAENKRLASLRETLLPELLSGRIRLPETAVMVTEVVA